MPICPQCSTTIHAGAEDQCPACGYSLRRANDIFGDALVEFTRVVDVAGALTHPQRLDLLKTLEDLERNISPAALCIYITDDGQMQHLRSHAHWILNHARIHHPSFGKRELHKAIEDSEIKERREGEQKEDSPPEVQESMFSRLWNRTKSYVRDAFFPYAPPVKQEWMLVLVVDVQLEMACFSWGYMLDPYVNPDSINSCIVSARLQFRERAFVPGLKKVMREAVHRIAADAHRVNRRLRRQLPPAAGRTSVLLAVLLGLGLLTAPAQAAPQRSGKPAAAQKPAASKPAVKKPAVKTAAKSVSKPAVKSVAKPSAAPSKPATKPAAKPSPKPAAKPSAEPKPPVADDEEIAEEIDDGVAEEPETTNAPAAPATEPKSPEPPAEKKEEKPAVTGRASVESIPAWQPQHYTALMQGELDTGYAALFPDRAANKSTLPAAAAEIKTDESDTTVLGKYCEQYAKLSSEYLRDPQGLLSSIEREDVEHVLHHLNAQTKFRIYLAVFKAGQEIPAELSAETLASSSLPVGEYAVLVQYPMGSAQGIELGYQLIKQEDAVRHEWLTKVRDAAAATGGGVEGVLAAVRQVSANVTPVSESFTPVTAESAAKAPLIEIEFRAAEKEKKVSFKDKLKMMAEEPANLPVVIMLVSVLAVVALVVTFLVVRRRSSVLLPTTPDVRLSSPYGAGVSRYVRYLEGQEAGKEKRIF